MDMPIASGLAAFASGSQNQCLTGTARLLADGGKANPVNF